MDQPPLPRRETHVDSLEELSLGRARVLSHAAIVVFAVIWFVPVLDSVWAAWPFHPANIQWRFRAVSMLGGTLITQMLAVTGATVLGAQLGWRRLVRAVSVIALAVMLSTVLGIIVHSMDFVQLRASVPDDARHDFTMAMARGTAQLLLGALASGVLGAAGLMASDATLDTRKGGSRVVVVPGPPA